ncbi:hypothetical protein JCM16303_000870 [Sporobolomyces ruberrimus]
MRSSVHLVWPLVLASFASSSSLDKPRLGFLQDVLSSSRSADQKYCKPTGQIQDACCDFETVENVNQDLFDRLHGLVSTPYFRYHKVDLYKECPFWQEEGSCMNRACGVETTEEDHLPEAWRSSTLGKLNQENSEAASPVGCKEIKDSEFCVLEDELDSEGVYVDLLENPERFTGYAGASSTRVWKAIYEENCFSPVPFIDPSRSSFEPGGTGFAPVSSSPFGGGLGGMGGGGMGGGGGNSMGLNQGGWGESEKRLVGSLAGPRDAGDEEVCLEKRVFYRVISGLHASISVHICDDFLDQSTGLWSPNLDCFITRIGQHPERLENMYFTYVLLLRAFSRSGPSLLKTLGETATTSIATREAGGTSTITKLEDLLKVAKGCPSTFDETSMFVGAEAQILKTEFKQHFRNVSRIMDCVGCDKCRLWGKLQITGLGTALKLLFSDEQEGLGEVVLSRSEAVAFINTLHRLSESLAAVDKFRQLWAKRGGKAQEKEEKETTSRFEEVKEVEAEDPKRQLEERSEVKILDKDVPPPTYEDAFDSSTTIVGNLSTLPLFCARAIWTKLVDLCDLTTGWRRYVGRGGEL